MVKKIPVVMGVESPNELGQVKICGKEFPSICSVQKSASEGMLLNLAVRLISTKNAFSNGNSSWLLFLRRRDIESEICHLSINI